MSRTIDSHRHQPRIDHQQRHGRRLLARARVVAIGVSALLWLVPPVPASEPPASTTAGPGAWELFPNDELYAPYLADPQAVGFGLGIASLPESAIPDSGSMRVLLDLGGRLGLMRYRPPSHPEWVTQLTLEVGFSGQFDIDHQLDNIGWDGIYGLQVTARRGRLTLKAGSHHLSSHIGDEYAERTGRARINYTRDELLLGASFRPRPGWRLYAETGWAHGRGNPELQEPGRLQLGVERLGRQRIWRGAWSWFAALDLAAVQERGWQVDPAVQVGLYTDRQERRWRVSLGVTSGRVALGELFMYDETSVILALSLDI
jgi:hypothetical protein